MISGQVCLRRGETLAAGCCWIYDNEIDWADDTCEDGGLVEVLDSRMRYQGTGFFNRRSKITVRLVSRERGETIDRAFWERRIRAAWENRQALGFSNACRVIFGEPDGLPGLTVDKFGDCLSFQIVSLGMERMRDDILAILAEVFRPQCIYERDDLAVRAKEALKAVPDSFREGSFGLGAGKLRTVFRIVLPSAVPGIFSGIILAIGRIVGETAALIFTAGTFSGVAGGVMESGRTLAVHMYCLLNEGLHRSEAYATAVVLLVMVIGINALSGAAAKRIARRTQ